MNAGKHTSWILALMLASAPVLATAQSQSEGGQASQGSAETNQDNAQQAQGGADQQQGSEQAGEMGSAEQAPQGSQSAQDDAAAKESEAAAGEGADTMSESGDKAADTAEQGEKGDTAQAGGSRQTFIPTQGESELLASELTGVTVMNASEEELGSVQNVLIDEKAGIRALVVGVGGFLGIGEKPVAVNFERFQHSRNQDGELTLTLEATREQLEQAPAFTTLAQQQAEAERAQQQQEAAAEQQQQQSGSGGQASDGQSQ